MKVPSKDSPRRARRGAESRGVVRFRPADVIAWADSHDVCGLVGCGDRQRRSVVVARGRGGAGGAAGGEEGDELGGGASRSTCTGSSFR